MHNGRQQRVAGVLIACLAMPFLITLLFAPIGHDEALMLL